MLDAQTITSFPHTEDFESFATCGTGCGASCTLSSGWVNDLGDQLDWLTDVGGTSSSNTGPSQDLNPGTIAGKYLYVETSCSGTGYPNRSANLWTPEIDLVGTNNIQFSFGYHMYGQTQGNLDIDVSTDGGLTWNTVWTLSGDQGDQWNRDTLSLAAYTGNTVRLRFAFVSGSNFYSDVAIDDILIYDLLAIDAGVLAIDSPSIPACSIGNDVWARVRNFGTDPLNSFVVNWSVNGVGQTAYNFSGTLAPGSDTSLFIGTAPIVAGDDLAIWTSSPNGVNEFSSGAGNDTATATVNPGLLGTYNIPGDYPDFTSAIADLNAFGVCGATVFEVQDGIYPEQIVLGDVTNASATNTITFRSQSGVANNVILTFAPTVSTDNYTIRFDGGDYFVFEDIALQSTGAAFGHVLEYTNGASNNQVLSCIIRDDGTTSTTSTNKALVYSESGSNENDNVFDGNVFLGGSYALYWYGVGSSDLESGTKLINNQFLDHYYRGIHLYYQDAPEILNNTFSTYSIYTGTIYSLYLTYCDNAMKVDGNTVNRAEKFGYGIYLSNCDGTQTSPIEVTNNFVVVGDSTNTATSYGVSVTSSGYVNVSNNSVQMYSAGSSGRGLYVSGGGAVNVYNNIFSMDGPGYAAYIVSAFNISMMDHNNLFSPNGQLGNYITDQIDLAAWQAATGFDMNSFSMDPMFFSGTDLHTCNDAFDGAGVSLPYIMTDIDGDMRAATPDIGADEFNSLSTTFSIGQDYTLCSDDSVQLVAGLLTGDSAYWSTGVSGNSIWTSGPGTYSVTVTGACGVASDDVEVFPSALVYTDFLDASNAVICNGDTAVLSSTMMGTDYDWSTLESSPTIEVATAGTYTLNLTDACGSGLDSVEIIVYNEPTADFSTTTSYLTAIFTNNSTNGGTTNSYSWDFGDGNSSTLEEPIHVYDTTGIYTVILTTTNDCGFKTDTVEVEIELPAQVGIADVFVSGDFAVFPNPTSSKVNVELELINRGDVTIQLVDILGKTLLKEDLGSLASGRTTTTLDVSSYNAGSYFILVEVNGSVYAKKLLISK